MGTIASQNGQQELKNIIQVTTMSIFKQLEKPFKNLNSFKGYLNRVGMNHQSSGHFSFFHRLCGGVTKLVWFIPVIYWIPIKNHPQRSHPQRSGNSMGVFRHIVRFRAFGQSSSGELFIIFRSFPCGCLSDSDDVILRTVARKPCVDVFWGHIKSHEIPWNDIKPI